jgi:hypothetical protein
VALLAAPYAAAGYVPGYAENRLEENRGVTRTGKPVTRDETQRKVAFDIRDRHVRQGGSSLLR